MDLSTSAYLGPANPSWADMVPEPQLRGLLTLAALVSDRVYLSDVHLGDNRHFADSYDLHYPDGLYTQFSELTRLGVVRLLLRDRSVRPAAEDVFEVHSFFDVYRSWQKQDPAPGWINKPGDQKIIRFLTELDSWVPREAITHYSYLDQKDIFIKEVRAAASSQKAAPWLGFDNSEMSLRLRASYDAILNKEWFSLTDFNILFHRAGLRPDSAPMAFHGLLNEVAYSRIVACSLVASHLRHLPAEEIFWPEGHREQVSGPAATRTPVEAILERASVVLDAPDLSVVAALSADEVMHLRESTGRGYFDLIHKMRDPLYLAAQSDFEIRLARAAAEYWQGIGDYLARNHPKLARKPGKLAVVLERNLPVNLEQYAEKIFSFAVNVGVPAIPGIQATIPMAQLVQGMKAALRFLFVKETPELRKIRKVVPDRTFLTKSNPIVLPPAA